MKNVDTTVDGAKNGITLKSKEPTEIKVPVSSIEILIGGPYTDRKEEHPYGHTALRVISNSNENVYDFGRYNGETGPYGEGRLRIWNNFQRYIKGENITGRVTTGFWYTISENDAKKINAHYDSLIAGLKPLKELAGYMKEYKLAEDYHALKNNCATITMTAVRLVILDLDFDVSAHNKGVGMSTAQKAAAYLSGWPNSIFMPADLQAMLQDNKKHPAQKIETYGAKK